MLDAAEAIWVGEIRERTLVERSVIAARMAQAEEWDTDKLPDVDAAMDLFREWLHSDDSIADLTPSDELRVSLGLGKKR